MANALEAASLVMIPSGYENGTLGSLKPLDGTGDFTFSRGSDISATRVNEDGYIEKGYENLLLQSNSFLTTWTQVNILPPTSGQVGYDGSSDAWYFEKTAAFGRLQQSISTSGVQTLSVYLKAKDSSWVNIEIGGTNTTRQYFDLTAPIETAKGLSNNIISSSIEDAGNGWRKCSVTYEGTKTFAFIFIAESSGKINGTSGSLYIQDAMLNQGLVAYPYVETTTAPVAGGILEDMPRLDYSGSCPALLLEPQRTNLVPHSEYFQGWHSDNNVSYSVNDATSPEGLTNATKVTATSTSNSFFRQTAFTSSGSNVFSVFAKYEDCEYIMLRSAFFTGGDEPKVWFDIQNGVKGGSIGDDVTYDIEDYGNGWYRCYVVFNVDAGDINGYCFVYLSSADESYNVVNGTGALIYGGQLEVGSYPTSYIPTYGTSQTRLADLATDAGDASTFNDSEGVLYAELSFTNDNSFKSLSLNSGSSTNRVMLYSSNPSYIGVNIRNTSGNQFNGNFAIDSTINHKIALKYKENDFALWIDGQERLSDLSGTTFPPSTLTQLDFDDANGNSPFNGVLKQIIVFPTALSDDECIELTTI